MGGGCIFIVSLTAIAMLHLAGQTLNMQANKFPPNVIFLAFCTAWMALIITAIPIQDRIWGYIENRQMIAKMFSMFETRSLTIFLYQVFAFNFTIRLVHWLFPASEGAAVTVGKAVLCLVTTIPICGVLAAVFGKIEEL